MRFTLVSTLFLVQSASYVAWGFSNPSLASSRAQQPAVTSATKTQLRPTVIDVAKFFAASTTSLRVASTTSSSGDGTDEKKKEVVRNAGKTLKELRQEGGMFTISTPIGALNPFALYYGIMSILLGIPWYIALKACQLMYFLSRGNFDKKRRIPVFLSHVWGTLLMRLSRSYPEIENRHILQELYSKKQPAMFVANHNSWMDIPFLGATVGWRNYKLVSKKELSVIPILGTAIRVGGNIMIDRTNRRSQIKTLKDGIASLKDGIHLCTFPEGTRSRTGRLLPFKLGAFKMAYKAGAPVVPISIINSGKVMPHGWMFAMKPSYKNAKVVIHEPVETEGRTEDEVAQEVRRRMIEGLPEDQKPLRGE